MRGGTGPLNFPFSPHNIKAPSASVDRPSGGGLGGPPMREELKSGGGIIRRAFRVFSPRNNEQSSISPLSYRYAAYRFVKQWHSM